MDNTVAATLLVTAAIIARQDGRILIASRPEGTSLAGMWEFPGGKSEPGEDPREAVVRECREELGIEVEVGIVYDTVFVPREKQCLLLLFYTARILRGEPGGLEGNSLAWATIDELEKYPLLEPDRPLVQRFRNRFPGFQPLDQPAS